MKATITWTCCWCRISSRRFECRSPSSPPRSWTRRSRVHLQKEQRRPVRPDRRGGSAGVMWGHVGGGRVRTWSAQLAVLLLLAGVHIHAPVVEGEGEEVLQARGRAHYVVQALQPFLTLLKGGELTPGGSNTKPNVTPATCYNTDTSESSKYFHDTVALCGKQIMSSTESKWLPV